MLYNKGVILKNIMKKVESNQKSANIMIAVLLAAVFLIFLGVSFNESITLVISGILLGVILVAIKPEIVVYIMALALPLINLNIYSGSFIIPVIDLIAIIGLLGFSLHVLSNRNRFLSLQFPFFIPFIIFWFATLVSSLVSPHQLNSLWYSIRWILLFYLAYVFLPVNIIKSKAVLKNTLIAFIFSGIAMAVMGVVSLKDQNFLYEPVRFTILSFNDISPFGLDQNLLVEVLLPSVFFLLALLACASKETGKKLITLCIIFLLFVLIGTFSRGAWISLFIFLGIYLWQNNRVNAKKIVVFGALSLVVLIPIFFYMFQLQTAFDVGVGSTRTRLLSSQIAWENFTESPWLGKGTGEYVNLINDSIRFRAQHGEGTDSNGIIQKLIAENGLFGLISYAFLSIYIFRQLYSQIAKETKDRIFLLSITLAAFSIFLFEFFNTSYYHGKMWFPIGVAWAAQLILAKKNNYEETS